MPSFLRTLDNLVNTYRMPVAPQLDPVDLKKAPVALARHVYGLAGQALTEAKGEYRRKVRYLPYPWRAVFTLTQMERQVMNGGFHQFFTDARGIYDEHLVDDLRLIDGHPHAPVIRSAWEKYRSYDYRDQWRNIGKSWDVFQQGYQEKRFEEQDGAFFNVGPDLSESLGIAIKKHAALFTAPPSPA